MKPAWLASTLADVDGKSDQALHLVAERAPLMAWSAGPDLKLAWGVRSPSLLGFEEYLERLLELGGESAAAGAHHQALGGTAATFELDWQGRHLEGSVAPVRDAGGAVIGLVGVALDEHRPGRGAGQGVDAATGLPDRGQFLARLRRSTAPGWCLDGLFMLLVDLDRFRDVNHRFGYAVGDELLAETATRLRRRIRPTDVVARFGADRFAVLLGGVRSGPDAGCVAERLLAEIALPLELEGASLKPSASVGIAVGTAGARAEDVVRDAERALSRAKVMGRPTYVSSSPGGDLREASLLQVETALRRALEQEDIRAQYRPVVSRKEGKVAGFEVVLWRRAAEGELPATRTRAAGKPASPPPPVPAAEATPEAAPRDEARRRALGAAWTPAPATGRS